MPPTASAPPPADARWTEIRIVSGRDTIPVRVELAETPGQWRSGLSGRAGLAPGTGMLFRFPEARPRGSSFWMYRTHFPLSMALLDSAGTILEIHDMEPCRSRIAWLCRRYAAGAAFAAALEVERGFFLLQGVAPGDRVIPVSPRPSPRPGGG